MQTLESPFGKARAVIFSDGTPWFVAKDVCEGLGLVHTGAALLRLKDEQKQVITSDVFSTHIPREQVFSLFGPTGANYSIISRGGFNDLVLESRKPVAREYRQWVTD